MRIASPLAGRVVPLADVPDPVFAQQMVGAGVALEPSTNGGRVSVLSPVDGTILKLHPHAFVVLTSAKKGVLVHVGIDTVRLRGRGFELVAREKESVEAGELVLTYDPAVVAEAGYSSMCPVVVMDSAPDSFSTPSVGTTVAAGDTLFDI